MSDDAESDDSGDLPLDMDDEAMEGVFAPAPDFDEENVEFSGKSSALPFPISACISHAEQNYHVFKMLLSAVAQA